METRPPGGAGNTKVAAGKLLGRINAKRLPEGREQRAFCASKSKRASSFFSRKIFPALSVNITKLHWNSDLSEAIQSKIHRQSGTSICKANILFWQRVPLRLFFPCPNCRFSLCELRRKKRSATFVALLEGKYENIVSKLCA